MSKIFIALIRQPTKTLIVKPKYFIFKFLSWNFTIFHFNKFTHQYTHTHAHTHVHAFILVILGCHFRHSHIFSACMLCADNEKMGEFWIVVALFINYVQSRRADITVGASVCAPPFFHFKFCTHAANFY